MIKNWNNIIYGSVKRRYLYDFIDSSINSVVKYEAKIVSIKANINVLFLFCTSS